MTKSLLLKGLAGAATVAGAVGGGSLFWFKDDIFGDNKAAQIKTGGNEFTQRELIDNAGLNCGLEGDDIGEETKECSIKENGTISIKVGDQTEEGVTFNSTSGSAKLKVGRSREGVEKEGKTAEVYNGKLKFVVDSGDISLTKSGGSTNIQKLEQFETYEIKEEDGKFYLSRKTKADVGIKNALGLGDLTLPDAGKEENRSFGKPENIKKIRFEGHNEGISVTSGEIGLKVSMSGDTTTFPYGYRFTFTFPGDITINTKSLKAKIPYEFKIKKATGGGNSLTLEQAWTDDNTFTKKAGLDCSNSNKECTVSTESQKLNVKVGNQKSEGITTVSTGKIKMEKDQEGYNQGLKFTIADGDASLSGGTGDGISKLEELETYEITEDGGKYYLTKKTSPDELIKTSLGIKDVCELPTTDTSVSCNLDEAKFKKINFDGKSDTTSGSGTLTISKANSTDFPFGYKFTFKTEKEATIKTDTKIKAKIPTDFKIKKGSGSGTSVSLTLEKAWDDAKYSLAEKVGLTCTSGSGEECCTKTGSVKLNVKKGSDIKTDIESATITSPAKIKVEKDKEGYNQGLKFTISGGDVSLTGGTKTSGTDFNTLEELETYEITEDKGKYYLTRKTEASEAIESQLGLKEAGCSLSGTSSTCTLSTEKIKKINFDNKDTNGASIGSSGSATLTITKADKTDFPFGYKFTLKSQQEITIKTDTNKVKANIPTDFKIKKGTSGASLTLEKAWTSSTLGAKVGLKCCDDSTGECTIDGTNSNKLRVKQLNESGSEIKEKNLTKKTSSSNSKGKIKVTKDQAGYNQGFKFEISDGFIELDGSTGTDENDKITRLGEYETYEIKEIGTEWFLSIKNKADDFVLKELGLENIDGCSSLKLPRSATGDTCDIKTLEILKKIKFGNTDSNSWPSSVNAQLQINQESSLPLGFKFTFTNNGSETFCLPDGNGGKVEVRTDGNSSVDYKIKKGSGTGGTTTLCLEKKDGTGSSSGCSK